MDDIRELDISTEGHIVRFLNNNMAKESKSSLIIAMNSTPLTKVDFEAFEKNLNCVRCGSTLFHTSIEDTKNDMCEFCKEELYSDKPPLHGFSPLDHISTMDKPALYRLNI